MNKDSSRNNNLSYISVLKNIALMLVVLGHAGCIYAGKWNYTVVNSHSEIIRYITEYIYSFHMPLFVFISGYIYNYNKERFGKYDSLTKLIINKSRRLLLPYFITGILFMVPLQMIFNVYTDDKSFIYRSIVEIILAKRPAHLWYLLMLFNVFIIFKVIEKWINRNNYIINFLILTLIMIISNKIPNIYQVAVSLRYLVYFYMGYIFSRHISEMEHTDLTLIKKCTFIVHLVLFNINYFIVSYINLNTVYYSVFNVIFNQVISMLGVACIFVYILDLCKCSLKVKNITNNKVYNLINKYNFYIYLVHQPIMMSIIRIIQHINIMPIVRYTLLFVATFILSISISILVSNKCSLLKLSKVK